MDWVHIDGPCEGIYSSLPVVIVNSGNASPHCTKSYLHCSVLLIITCNMKYTCSRQLLKCRPEYLIETNEKKYNHGFCPFHQNNS